MIISPLERYQAVPKKPEGGTHERSLRHPQGIAGCGVDAGLRNGDHVHHRHPHLTNYNLSANHGRQSRREYGALAFCYCVFSIIIGARVFSFAVIYPRAKLAVAISTIKIPTKIFFSFLKIHSFRFVNIGLKVKICLPFFVEISGRFQISHIILCNFSKLLLFVEECHIIPGYPF